jgi:hypothetical protein
MPVKTRRKGIVSVLPIAVPLEPTALQPRGDVGEKHRREKHKEEERK